MKDDYFPGYFQTEFFGEFDPTTFPSEFAIITACSPTGQKWPAARNRVADESLKFRLRKWPIQRITGRSPDGTHAEPGWLVPCTKRTAVNIGREFLQDAIYWVSRGEVFILDTATSRAPGRAGLFIAKYRREKPNPIPNRLIVGTDECSRFVHDSTVKLGEREFLFTGESSQSPYHTWRSCFSLLFNARSGVWALEETALPCGNDGEAEDEPPLDSAIVALIVDCNLTPETASLEVLEAWRAKTAQWLDVTLELSSLGRKLPESFWKRKPSGTT